MHLKHWGDMLASSLCMRPKQRIAPGVYPYTRTGGGTVSRIHLRVDADGTGLLLANAAAAARLHPSGVLIAKGLLEGDAEEVIAKRLLAAFRSLQRGAAMADIEAVDRLLRDMDKPQHRFPVLNLVDPAFTSSIGQPIKPLLADVPLAPSQRMRPVLEALWRLDIPHAVFVLGPAPSAEDLALCVERAEDIGMISGARGHASTLQDPALLDRLGIAGIDYLALGCASEDAALHDRFYGPGDFASLSGVIEGALARNICPVGVVPLTQANLPKLESTLGWLSNRGVADVMLFAIATAKSEADGGPLQQHELIAAAQRVEYAAESLDMRLIWCPTVQFDRSLGLVKQVCRGPRTSGELAVLVEPDGSVFLPRGLYRTAGNVLSDDWTAITKSDAYAAYRQLLSSDTHCSHCPGLAICAADCPQHACGWAAPAKPVEETPC